MGLQTGSTRQPAVKQHFSPVTTMRRNLLPTIFSILLAACFRQLSAVRESVRFVILLYVVRYNLNDIHYKHS